MLFLLFLLILLSSVMFFHCLHRYLCCFDFSLLPSMFAFVILIFWHLPWFNYILSLTFQAVHAQVHDLVHLSACFSTSLFTLCGPQCLQLYQPLFQMSGSVHELSCTELFPFDICSANSWAQFQKKITAVLLLYQVSIWLIVALLHFHCHEQVVIT